MAKPRVKSKKDRKEKTPRPEKLGEKQPPVGEKPKEELKKWKPEDGPLDPTKHIVEPEEGDNIPIGPGEVDAMGNYYMEEIDFLRLQSRKERRNNCKSQAEALRLRAELTQMKMTIEVNRLTHQAEAMEKASRIHDQTIQDQLTELSKKYNIDFKDPSVVVDEELGKIIATDPTKGLPRLKEGE